MRKHTGDYRKRAIALGVKKGWVTPEDREKLQKQTYCSSCGKYTRPASRMIDHRIPLIYGGLHHRFNLQMLCKRCNSAKGGRL